VNMVMNLRVPENMGNFLIGTSSFSMEGGREVGR